MCMACAEKRQAPQKFEPTVNLDSSWDGQKPEPPLKLEHLEPHDMGRQQRRSRSVQQNTRVQPQKREKLQEERRENRTSAREPLSSNGRRRGPSQASETQRGRRSSGVLQPFASHRVSRESLMRNRPASTVERRTGPSIHAKQRGSVETPTRPRKSSNSRSEPRGSEKKGQRLSSTADILGMSRSLELPPNYFDMSSSSPTFSATSAPEHNLLDLRQLEMQMPHVVEHKNNETEEERQRRRSASYAHMLLRMRRHYDTVQVNGTHNRPTTAPPRRIRAERRAKSVAVRSAKEEPVKIDPDNFAIDLDYLRAYKDAR
ncbi:hypothetical protein V7S43_009094 [Phytophthora oleae]|uniref:Uncharacterized protein n=1 Tax=Phytophthora oleae TaxID=2107226 RepID=A0ABD3FGW6_9STRA